MIYIIEYLVKTPITVSHVIGFDDPTITIHGYDTTVCRQSVPSHQPSMLVTCVSCSLMGPIVLEW